MNLERFNRFVDMYSLTKRETEIFKELLTAGNTRKKIAKKLYIECGTVTNHTRSIFMKLRVFSRTDLVIKYFTETEPQD